MQNSYSGQTPSDFPQTYWAAPSQLPTQFAPLPSHFPLLNQEEAVKGLGVHIEKLGKSLNIISASGLHSQLLELQTYSLKRRWRSLRRS